MFAGHTKPLIAAIALSGAMLVGASALEAVKPLIIDAPAEVTGNEGMSLFVDGLRIEDPGFAGEEDLFQVELIVGNGAIVLPGAILDLVSFEDGASGAPRLVFSGPFDAVSAALAGVVYQPLEGFVGEDRLLVKATLVGAQGDAGAPASAFFGLTSVPLIILGAGEGAALSSLTSTSAGGGGSDTPDEDEGPEGESGVLGGGLMIPTGGGVGTTQGASPR